MASSFAFPTVSVAASLLFLRPNLAVGRFSFSCFDAGAASLAGASPGPTRPLELPLAGLEGLEEECRRGCVRHKIGIGEAATIGFAEARRVITVDRECDGPDLMTRLMEEESMSSAVPPKVSTCGLDVDDELPRRPVVRRRMMCHNLREDYVSIGWISIRAVTSY